MDISHIFKIGKESHINSFIQNGEMYFNTINYFNVKENKKIRFDTLEGAEYITPVKKVIFKDNDGNVFSFSKEERSLEQAFYSYSSDNFKGNIFCCSYITPETKDNFKKLDSRFSDFGDTIALIFNPKEFINLIVDYLSQKNIDFCINTIEYINIDEFSGELDCFKKRNEYSYQQELRIWLNSKKNEPLKIHLGSLKSIAEKYKLTDIIKNT